MLSVLTLLPFADPVPMTVTVGKDVTHRINPLYTGCHSDSGFTHQVRGFSSQMIFGESFEKPQPNCSSGLASDAWSFSSSCKLCGATNTSEDATVAPAMHGASSRRLTIASAAGAGESTFAALHNRALGSEGMFFEAGKPYEGYLFAKCDASATAPVELVVRLEDKSTALPTVLSSMSFSLLPPDCGTWTKLDFELTPSAGTSCEGIEVGSDPTVYCTKPTGEAGHSCVRCGGQFTIGLASVGTVLIDYVVLQPGAWGRLADKAGQPLPVRKDVADTLRAMGTTILRVGGSFASVTAWPDGGGGTPASTVSGEFYQWPKWTGPVWMRPSVGAVWNAYSGNSYSLIGGWGPFEVIDMCNALDIEPVITTTSSSSAAELADLVEYCHGDGESTPMGRRRVADGHPAKYNVSFFELGNEQYNGQFVSQVAAMEARAFALGLPNGTMKYLFPDNNVRGVGIEGRGAPAGCCRLRLLTDGGRLRFFHRLRRASTTTISTRPSCSASTRRSLPTSTSVPAAPSTLHPTCSPGGPTFSSRQSTSRPTPARTRTSVPCRCASAHALPFPALPAAASPLCAREFTVPISLPSSPSLGILALSGGDRPQ